MELDEWTGFQFDSAVALKYHLQEENHKLSQLDVVMDGIANVCRGLGMRVSKKKQKPISSSKNEPKPVAQVLQELGGPGVAIERIKKDRK